MSENRGYLDSDVAFTSMKVVSRIGAVPALGYVWQHSTTFAEAKRVSIGELQTILSGLESQLAAHIQSNFWAVHPFPTPEVAEETVLVTLADQWMVVTTHDQNVYVDCTYAFVPKAVLDAEASVAA